MRLNILFPIFALVTSILISGCGPAQVLKPNKKINRNNGVFVVAITKDKGGLGASLAYRREGEKNKHFFGVDDHNDYLDSQEEYGRVAVFEVPAGNYSLVNWQMYDDYRGLFFSPKHLESINFTVKPNTVTYIGHYHFKTLFGKNIFDITIPIGGKVIISDNYSTDISIAKIKNPNIGSLNFTRDVNSIVDWGIR